MSLMTKEEFDKKYVGEKIAVNCKTMKEAVRFLDLATKFGYNWMDGDSYSKRHSHEKHDEDMCYYIFNGTYRNLDYFKYYDFKIVRFDEKKFDTKIVDFTDYHGDIVLSLSPNCHKKYLHREGHILFLNSVERNYATALNLDQVVLLKEYLEDFLEYREEAILENEGGKAEKLAKIKELEDEIAKIKESL